MVSKSGSIVTGIKQFASDNNNKFTVKMVAEHFEVSEDTARKVIRNLHGIAPQREGTSIVWSFVEPGKRIIKTSPEARKYKILRYFRSACYNAVKLGMSQREMVSQLKGWMEEYEVINNKTAQSIQTEQEEEAVA